MWLSSALAAVIATTACSPPPPTTASLESTVIETHDSLVVQLSQSPTLAALRRPAAPDAPRTRERVKLPAFVRDAHLADLAALPGGRMALLLRDLREVVVVADGVVERRFGRRGQGPGEFRSPLAIEASSAGFAILDLDRIELFSATGESLGRARLPWVPDWSLQAFRQPYLHFRQPFQSGPEDMGRRMARAGTGYVVLASERGRSALPPAPDSVEYLQLTVFAISPETLEADSTSTVRGSARVRSRAAVLDGDGRPMANIQMPVVEPLFGERPLVAGSTEWSALYDPIRGTVEVSKLNDHRRTVVTWPRGHVSLSDSTRVLAAEWTIRDLVAGAPTDELARAWARNGRRASFEQKLRASAETVMSETLADVAALFAAGRCLWLVGMDPRDFSDGTGHWGLAVNIDTGATSGPHRLAARGSQLRDVGEGYAYSTSRTDDGELLIERTPVPACAE